MLVLARPRSLHEAIIKCRFSETILKAKLAMNGSADPQRVEKMHYQEKIRIEAKIKAAEAVRLKKEREAAQLALMKMEMEKSVVDNNFETELKSLCGCSDPLKSIISGYPLRSLGLVLKEEFRGGDDDDEGLGLVLDLDDDDDADVELKKKTREAARNALQALELSVVSVVDIQQNLETERQLHLLSGCRDPLKNIISGYPLRSLGLVLKDEFRGGDDDEDDIEEGEILD